MTALPAVLFDPQHHQITARLRLAGSLLALAALLWPERYWPGGIPVPVVFPQVRTPFIGTRLGDDGTVWLTADVPQGAAHIGDLIIARANEPQVTSARVFQKDDAIRIYAALGQGVLPVQATIDVLDQQNNLTSTIRVPTSAAHFVGAAVQPSHAMTKRAAQIDVTLPLSDFEPGGYRLRLTATDGASTSERIVDITVVLPRNRH